MGDLKIILITTKAAAKCSSLFFHKNKMTKQEFINRVLLIMNEAGMADVQGNSFYGADTVQIDRHIEGSYVDAWRRVARVAPRTWLGNKSFKSVSNNPVPSLEKGTGYVVLPDDFYLLTKFKMAGWRVAAMEASVANSRVANIQSNEYTMGSQMRPVVIIENKDLGGNIKPVLEYYSLPKGLPSHVVEEALYVPVVKELSTLNLSDDLGINDQIIVPLAYLSAATVFTIFEKIQIAQGLEARAEAVLPGVASIKGTNITIKQ